MYRYSDFKTWSSVEDILADENIIQSCNEMFLFKSTKKDLRQQILKELEEGTGVLLFKSRLIESLGLNESRDFFKRFCEYLGRPVPINLNGDKFKDIEDCGLKDSAEKPVRGHLTNSELPFHSDRADITALFCFSPSFHGGESKLISSRYVVKKIRDDFPHLETLLTQSLPHDLRGEFPGMDFCHIPILYQDENNFVFRYIRRFFDSVKRHKVALRPEWVELYDSIDSILNDPANHISFKLEKGDILVLNNHTVLHAREKFENDGRSRKLFRCWLTHDNTRELPVSFLPIFHQVKGGQYRGGVQLL